MILTLILLMLSLFVFKPLSCYTTIGEQLWFGDFISNVTDKIQNERVCRLITTLSYNKLFVCNHCHVFHMTWITGMLYGIFTWSILPLIIGIAIGLIGFYYSIHYDKKLEE